MMQEMPIIFMEVMIMLTYEELSRHPRHFLSFTGLRLEDFEKKRLDTKNRIRAIGGGRDFKLPLRNRVLMMLV
jgi:hypothetical protein